MGAPRIETLLDDTAAPDAVDAVVFEQDTELILAVDRAPAPPQESVARLVEEALAARGAPLGSVLVREGAPTLLLAVVHDLDREPSWDAAAVAAAYSGVFRLARERGWRGIVMPLLGTVHGRMSALDSRQLLEAAARTAPALERVWLRR